jgi:hypothetical protein
MLGDGRLRNRGSISSRDYSFSSTLSGPAMEFTQFPIQLRPGGGGTSTDVKWSEREADHLNARSLYLYSPYIFMARCLITHRIFDSTHLRGVRSQIEFWRNDLATPTWRKGGEGRSTVTYSASNTACGPKSGAACGPKSGVLIFTFINFTSVV